MTPRERWLAILNGGKLDRIPTDYWATAEFHAKLVGAVGCDGEALHRKVGIDVPHKLGPRSLREHHPDDPSADIWGIRYRNINYGTGEYAERVFHPLANMTSAREVDSYRWPSPDDFDYSAITDELGKDDGYRIVQAGAYEPLLLYMCMRGMELGYEDMIDSPTIVEAGLRHIFDFCYEHNRRIWTAGGGKIDMGIVAEDLGGQQGPLISLEMYRRFLRPL